MLPAWGCVTEQERSRDDDDGYTGDPTGSSASGAGAANGFEALSWMEEQLLGKWYRLHQRESGDDERQYFIFYPDRTGCRWSEPAGGGSRDNAPLTDWSLNEEVPVADNVFGLVISGPGNGTDFQNGDEFHFLEDEIWRGGYSNLRMRRSDSEKECE